MQFIYKGPWGMGKRYAGEVDGFYISVQVFSEPSRFGIAEGKISRLEIYPERSSGMNSRLVNYERGWDRCTPFPLGKFRTIVEKVVHHFDNKNVDWSFEERRLL